jgi:glycosyltransferase involved in cell wall biosynthesis
MRAFPPARLKPGGGLRGAPAAEVAESAQYDRAPVKLLIVTLYFPPAGGAGVQRPLKLAAHLPALGIETHVLAPADPKWIHTDSELEVPTQAWVHRARFIGPRGRRPAEELHGTTGLERASRQARLAFRRVLLPDENVSWNLTAIPAALRIVREQGIDVVLTTSPPPSMHLVGAAVKAATGVRWVADLRDSPIAHPHRRAENLAVRAKEKTGEALARLVARSADAIVAVSPAIADEVRALEPRGPVHTIANGCDFDDFAGLEYRPGERFRITHTGSFFGKRDPRPFLTALAQSRADAVARFVGDFRTSDREWAEGLRLGDRLELHPYAPRRRALELQRDSEALLLLIPEASGRGRGVLSGKVYEYLAAERPILAVVPPDGAAAALLRETGAGIVVAPDDIKGMRHALEQLEGRFRAGRLNGTPLAPAQRDRLSRRARVEELAELLRSLV